MSLMMWQGDRLCGRVSRGFSISRVLPAPPEGKSCAFYRNCSSLINWPQTNSKTRGLVRDIYRSIPSIHNRYSIHSYSNLSACCIWMILLLDYWPQARAALLSTSLATAAILCPPLHALDWLAALFYRHRGRRLLQITSQKISRTSYMYMCIWFWRFRHEWHIENERLEAQGCWQLNYTIAYV